MRHTVLARACVLGWEILLNIQCYHHLQLTSASPGLVLKPSPLVFAPAVRFIQGFQAPPEVLRGFVDFQKLWPNCGPSNLLHAFFPNPLLTFCALLQRLSFEPLQGHWPRIVNWPQKVKHNQQCNKVPQKTGPKASLAEQGLLQTGTKGRMPN